MKKFNRYCGTIKKLLRSSTEDPKNFVMEGHAMVATVTINADRSVSIDQAKFPLIKEYDLNPVQISPDQLKREFDKSNKIVLNNILLGSGGGILLELPNGTTYIVTSYRDSKAPTYPNTLDSPTGVVDTPNILDTCVRETFEEVILMKDEKAIVPQFISAPWSVFNSIIEKIVLNGSKNFGIDQVTKIDVNLASVQNSLHLNGDVTTQIDIALCADKHGRISRAALVMPPIIIQEDSLAKLTLRDTLAIETNGKVPERDIVLLKLKDETDIDPDVHIYRRGRLLNQYRTFIEFVDARNMSPSLLFAPPLAATMKAIGARNEHLRYYQSVSELIRPA